MDILLLERLVPEALAWLEERHPVQSRIELANDTSAIRKAIYKSTAVVLPRKLAITREFLDFAPLLKAVARLQAGDNTDLEACRQRQIRVIQANTANIRANAEYLLAGLLMLYRSGISAALAGDSHAGLRLGREINGSVIGIFGLAPAAHTLALMLHALGAKLIGYDPAVHSTAPIWGRLQIRPVTLSEMLAQSDAISAQVMFASRYQGFINDKMLSHCKRGQLWVGVSRSKLFDPQALARALTDGRIEAALLDCADAGFAAKGSPLHGIPNLYLTPRLGPHTLEARVRASWYVVHRLHEALTTPVHSGADQLNSGSDQLSTGPMGLEGPVSGYASLSGSGPLGGR